MCREAYMPRHLPFSILEKKKMRYHNHPSPRNLILTFINQRRKKCFFSRSTPFALTVTLRFDLWDGFGCSEKNGQVLLTIYLVRASIQGFNLDARSD